MKWSGRGPRPPRPRLPRRRGCAGARRSGEDTARSLAASFSRTLDGAGGVGGLLMVREHTASATHFAGYDGNGNVTALVKTDGSVSARYEYSPFGEPIRATGPLARVNPFRWSTKFTDEESGLVYYGYRYYSPTLGRWISRDPIKEGDGPNLYAFLVNNPISGVDFLGQFFLIDTLTANSEDSAGHARFA